MNKEQGGKLALGQVGWAGLGWAGLSPPGAHRCKRRDAGDAGSTIAPTWDFLPSDSAGPMARVDRAKTCGFWLEEERMRPAEEGGCPGAGHQAWCERRERRLRG